MTPSVEDKPSLYDQVQNTEDDSPDAGQNENTDPSPAIDSGPTVYPDTSGCRLGDVWQVEIASTVAEGEGCQNGGGSAIMEGASQKLLVVMAENNELALELIEPPPSNLSYFSISALFEQGASSCNVVADLEVGINWPNDSSHQGDTTQTLLAWAYVV